MSFEELYLMFFPTLARFCFFRVGGNRARAEDVAAHAFRVLLQKWDTLQSYDEAFLKHYLFGIAGNKIKEDCRNRHLRDVSLNDPQYLAQMEAQQAENCGEMDSVIEKLTFQQYIREIERQLNPQQRMLFHWKVAENLSYSEIAEKMDISENAVKIRWSRLKEKLKPIVKNILKNQNL